MAVQTLLAIVVSNSWSVHQLDVNNTFLCGDLEEDIYMTIPPSIHYTNKGISTQEEFIPSAPVKIANKLSNSQLVCRLHK